MRIRYKRSSLLLLVCLITSSFLLYNLGILIASINQDRNAENLYKNLYTIEVKFPLGNIGLTEDLISQYSSSLADYIFSLDHGNIIITDYNASTELSLSGKEMNLILVKNEDLKFDINDKYPTDESGIVYLGQYVYNKNKNQNKNHFFTVYDYDMRINAVLKSVASGGIDNRIYIDISHFNSKKELLNLVLSRCSFDYKFVIQSDRDIEKAVNSYVQGFDDIGFEATVIDNDFSSSYQNRWYESLNKLFLEISITIAFVVCYYASKVWAKDRCKEFAIRRAFGCSYKQIFANLYMELLRLSALSIVLSLVLEYLYINICNLWTFDVQRILGALIVSVTGTFVVDIYVTVISYLIIRRHSVTNSMRL